MDGAMNIDFCVWAPDEATFWQSWIDAGICTAPRVFAPEYPGIIVSDETSQGWKATRSGAPATGWHANIRVSGPLVAEFTYGLEQIGSIWDRTWAAEVFLLAAQDADENTGFPAGMRNSVGVTYADPAALSSPSNIWA